MSDYLTMAAQCARNMFGIKQRPHSLEQTHNALDYACHEGLADVILKTIPAGPADAEQGGIPRQNSRHHDQVNGRKITCTHRTDGSQPGLVCNSILTPVKTHSPIQNFSVLPYAHRVETGCPEAPLHLT